MSENSHGRRKLAMAYGWLVPLTLGATTLGATTRLVATDGFRQATGILLLAGFGGLSYSLLRFLAGRPRRAAGTIREMVNRVESVTQDALAHPQPGLADAAEKLSSVVESLMAGISRLKNEDSILLDARVASRSGFVPSLTRSAIFDPVVAERSGNDPTLSGEFSSVSDMIARLDPKSLRWLDSTPAEQRFLGYDLKTLRGMSYLDVVHPDHRELAGEQLRSSIGKGEALGLLYRIKTAKGEPKAVEINVGVRYTPARAVDHLRCHITDVTDKLRASKDLRKRSKALLVANQDLMRANQSLRELTDRYTDLYQNAPAMYFSVDRSGVFVECNNTLLATLGYAREELIGRPYCSILPEWRRPKFEEDFVKYLNGDFMDVESHWIKSDGGIIDVWVTGTAVLGPDGSVVRSRSVAQDITARRALEAELQEKNARLALTNEDLERKNKELDDFSHVVSHDLQEPLRSLLFFSIALLRERSDALDDEGKRQLGFVLDSAKRMQALVRDLLELSRSGQPLRAAAFVDLSALLTRLRGDFMGRLAGGAAEIRTIEPFPPVWGDRDRIAQLLGNLISNGLKYQKPDARPFVEISARESNDGVVISVRDNGIGIDPKDHSRIFQIFRRLHAHDEFEGTGAGLAICQKIAQAHGGYISVESRLGEGATFFVMLPRPCGEGIETSKV